MQQCEIPSTAHKTADVTFPDPQQDLAASPQEQTAVLAGGCFWCVEAIYRALDGVNEVVSGYAGGTAASANYNAVCSGRTDHAEVIRLRFDARKTTYGQILKVFFSVAHDPTQLNRQGNDLGRQYRSAIFFADETQRTVAAAYIKQLDAAGVFQSQIVTTLEPLTVFYPAEDYHQNYAALHPDQPYIAAVSAPKVEKLKKTYPERLKAPR